MGDIHGNAKGLKQCLERSNFNKEEDLLIQLGDVADGWSEVYECVEELLSIKNLISIKGNHDDEWLQFLSTGIHRWDFEQGARATLNSYRKHQIGDMYYTPDTHIKFFREQHLYYIDDENRLFIHGGFNRHEPLKGQPTRVFYWDRDLWGAALSYESMKSNNHKFKMVDNFKEVFIGHTATINWDTDKPMRAANIWNLDTGSGFAGKLTIMNIETKEYFQSDLVQELYPEEHGRN